MTFLEQADRLVRSHPANKELMELGFGCEVKLWTDNGKPYGDGARMGNAEGVFLYETESYYHVQYTKGVDGRGGAYKKIIEFQPEKDRIVEILGKPPHLEHYLRVLASLSLQFEHDETKIMVRVGYGVEKPPSDYITFNLTTGAPATEKDAEEFIELVS